MTSRPLDSHLLIETPRLRIRPLQLGDAPAILELVNGPEYLRYIGDKQIRSIADAERYLTDGPFASYARHGFGLYAVCDRDTGVWMGNCGLLKRDTLEHPDIGYAFLPAYWGRGIAFEAAEAVIEHARGQFGLSHLQAIVSPDNAASIRLLEKLGFTSQALRELTPGDPVQVFIRELT